MEGLLILCPYASADPNEDVLIEYVEDRLTLAQNTGNGILWNATLDFLGQALSIRERAAVSVRWN